MKIDTLITVLGWEDRFLKGTAIILKKYDIASMILISFTDYLSMNNMKENKSKIEKKATELNIEIKYIKLTYADSVNNWKTLGAFFEKNEIGNDILINTTTFPRETIWTLLFFLKSSVNKVNYIYFKPGKYSDDWLTKNHKNPRLLFKHSGIFNLDQKLVLFIITGYDPNRMNSIIEYYEPDKIIIFNQNGKQFNNKIRNNIVNIDNSLDFEKVEINNYDVEIATMEIRNKIIEYSDYNIIIASQGPKLSALSTYKNFLMSDSRIALAYVPVRDFNSEYSSGFNPNYIKGILEL